MSILKEIVPIILAGGASTRMGRPKALLDFDGRCCLELTLDAVRGLGQPIVVLGAAQDEIRERVDLSHVHVVRNDAWQRGQTSSLKAGLSSLPPAATAFLLDPVDYPLVRVTEVARLVEAFATCEDSVLSVFLPLHAGRSGHPVLCRREIAREFLELPDAAAARSVTKRDSRRIEHVIFDQPYVVTDLDTPEDYAACLDVYRTRK